MAKLEDVKVEDITLKEFIEFTQRFVNGFPALRIRLEIPSQRKKEVKLI